MAELSLGLLEAAEIFETDLAERRRLIKELSTIVLFRSMVATGRQLSGSYIVDSLLMCLADAALSSLGILSS